MRDVKVLKNNGIGLGWVAASAVLAGILVVVGCGSGDEKSVAKSPSPGQGITNHNNGPFPNPTSAAMGMRPANANGMIVGEALPELPPQNGLNGNTPPTLDGVWVTSCVRTRGNFSHDRSRKTVVIFDQGRIYLRHQAFTDNNCTNDLRSITSELQGSVNVALSPQADDTAPTQGSLEISQYQLLLSFDERSSADDANRTRVCGSNLWDMRRSVNVSGLACVQPISPNPGSPVKTDPSIAFIDAYRFGPVVQPRGTVYGANLTWSAPTYDPNTELQHEEMTITPIQVNVAKTSRSIPTLLGVSPSASQITGTLKLSRNFYRAKVNIAPQELRPTPFTPPSGDPFAPAKKP